MSALPDWLPKLLDTDGSWDDVRDRLYSVFEADFKNGKPQFAGLPIWWDRRCLEGDQHEESFWHLITKDDKDTGDRLLDTPRAKRLRWCRATVDNASKPDVLVFDYLEASGKVRTYLWIEQCDYVVILERVVRKGKAIAHLLITAYSLDGPSRRRAMRQKYDSRQS